MTIGELKTEKLEAKWQKEWEEQSIHHFDEHDAKRPLYVIDTPPPFPTGEFHTGSTLNWCYIDFVARYKRMTGHNVLFPQGWDCHGFPTEVKVEQKYGRLPRAQFREAALKHVKEMISTIRPQMKQLAFSIDWKHEYFTIDPEYYRKVQLSLLQMWKDGLVYRAQHPVLWSPHCGSAIAKAETEEVERETLLNHIKFSSDAGDIVIATTRPEYLHACVAVMIHPEDPRAAKLVGKTAIVPLFGHKVPIIKELDVEMSFGTGLVMLCTFGDKADVVHAYRHRLPVKRAIDDYGKLLDAGPYTGLSLAAAREKILEELKSKGLIVKQETIKQTVRIHDRCKKPTEYVNSLQWFIKTKDDKDQILNTAHEMRWTPPHALTLLEDWTNGLEWDWVISRQRNFGIPLPFWLCEKHDHVVVAKPEQLPVDPAKDKAPVEKCPECGSPLRGETSICDGWVDSSITPLIIAGWPDDKERFKRMYPSALRPQGTDIIRTWAFYTIARCKRLTGKAPFQEVLVNGMVLGADKKKMSKSLGNYVEAKDVIQKAGADSLRQWAALSGHTGKDNVFYWKDVDYGKAFATKLWNAARFTEKALEGYAHRHDQDALRTLQLRAADRWLLSRLTKATQTAKKAMDSFDFFTALTTIQDFFWHEFCDYYLEEVKHRTYGNASAESKLAAQWCLHKTIRTTLGLLAPFMPYTTEELWQELFKKEEKEKSIHLTSYPSLESAYINEAAESIAGVLHELTAQARKFKAAKGLALNETLSSAELAVPSTAMGEMREIEEELRASARVQSFSVKQSSDGKVYATFNV